MAFLPTIRARPFEAEQKPRPFGRIGASGTPQTVAKPGLVAVWQERRLKTAFLER
jgi:hypothetical protein